MNILRRQPLDGEAGFWRSSRTGQGRKAGKPPTASQFSIEGRVTRVEMMGAEQFVYIRLPADLVPEGQDEEIDEFCVRLGVSATHRTGDILRVTFSRNAARAFREDGLAI